jgi:uncharacterized membrane protein YozB (DUF420 family)
LPFTRLNAGIMVVALLFLIGAGVALRGRGLTRQIPIWGLAGTLISVSAVSLTLISTGALRLFWQQSVLWPLRWSSGAGYGKDSLSVIVQDFVNQLLPVALFLSVLALYVVLRKRQASHRSRLLSTAYSLAAGVAIVVMITRQGVSADISTNGPQPSAANTFWQAMTAPNVNYLTFFVYLAAVLAVLAAIAIVVAWARHRVFPPSGAAWILLIGLTIVGCSQVYPVPESRHEWWGLPVGLVLTFVVVDRFSPLRQVPRNPLVLPVVFATLMAGVSAAAYMGIPRAPGTSGTITEGMFVSQSVQDSIDSDTRLLRDSLPPDEQAIFVAYNGDASVLTGSFRSLDAFFVSWGNVPQIEERLGTQPPIVRELPPEGPDDFARQINYFVKASNGTYAVLLPREQ